MCFISRLGFPRSNLASLCETEGREGRKGGREKHLRRDANFIVVARGRLIDFIYVTCISSRGGIFVRRCQIARVQINHERPAGNEFEICGASSAFLLARDAIARNRRSFFHRGGTRN